MLWRYMCTFPAFAFPGKTAGKVLSEDLLAYYDNMTKAILGHNEQVTKVQYK